MAVINNLITDMLTIGSSPEIENKAKYGLTIDQMIGDVDSNGVLQSLISSTPVSFASSEIRSIDAYVLDLKFYNKSINLVSVDLPNLTHVGEQGMYSTFNGLTSLVSVSMPNLITVDTYGLGYTFSNCTSLRTVNFKKLSCNLAETDYPLYFTFYGCTSLELLDCSESTAIPTLMGNTFKDTNNTFIVVVPDALYETWIAAKYWSDISSRIVKASEYNQ